MLRRILHIDMDAFFASVEQVHDPSLRGKPLIIGGAKTDRRGVVSTASYEARKFGVHSAMPLAEAKRLCPHGIYMRGNFSRYREASKAVRVILQDVSPIIQLASIDEAYVDVSGSQRLFGGDEAIGAYIKRRIREATDLPSTIAITPNKLVSKIGSDEAKPDGFLSVQEGGEAAFMRPLRLEKVPGIGPRTRDVLAAMGVMTVGALADLPTPMLLQAFGQHGYALQRTARGESTSKVEPHATPKSISRETTFREDTSDWAHLERVLIHLTERAMHTLREQQLEAKRVTLKVRYSDFSTKTFAHTLRAPTCLDRDAIACLQDLLPKGKERFAPVRLIGVALGQLTCNQHQLALLDGRDVQKWERALESVDRVRGKHGFEALRLAKSMDTNVRSSLRDE
jgi:DNA polymerase-4